MKIYGINLEADIQILAYSDTKEVVFKKIDRIQSNQNKISFNALINIKQSSEVEEKSITLSLVHIIDDGEEDPGTSGKRSNQSLARIQIGTLPLSRPGENLGITPSQPNHSLLKDPWDIKQLIHWSFEGVPVRGPGTYAVILSVQSPDNSESHHILDCDYIEVF